MLEGWEVLNMPTGPFVVSVTELRRRLSPLLAQVDDGERPLFITQFGQVTAVLVSRSEYRSWQERASARPPMPPIFPRENGVAPSQRSARLTPLPSRKVWTAYGMCDYEIARVLAAQGVETELVLTEEGWLTDDEG
jgi:prevent-host-death family protein